MNDIKDHIFSTIVSTAIACGVAMLLVASSLGAYMLYDSNKFWRAEAMRLQQQVDELESDMRRMIDSQLERNEKLIYEGE